MNDLGAVGDVRPAVAGRNGHRDQQVVGEDGGFVGPAGALGVFQDDDLVIGGLARLDLRIGFGGRHPQPARGVPVHLDRLLDHRLGGKEIDLPAVGELEALALGLRIVDPISVGAERADG